MEGFAAGICGVCSNPTKRGKANVAGKGRRARADRHCKVYHETGGHPGMKYAVVFEQGPKSVGAMVPDLPGCFCDRTQHERGPKDGGEAIEFQIRCLREAGDAIPEPSHDAEDVEVAV